MRQFLGETWIDDEELAYNAYSGAPSRSNRRGLVRFPDGKLRKVKLGVADTFFSIPAIPSHGRKGTVMVNHTEALFDDSIAEEFHFYPFIKESKDEPRAGGD